MCRMFLLSLGALFYGSSIHGSPVITFCVRPYTELVRIVTINDLQDIISLPGGIERTHFAYQSHTPAIQGVYATYAGQIAFSDCTGRITFNLKYSKKEITLVVTDHIYPLRMSGLTVQKFVIDDADEVRYYKYARVVNEALQKPVWRVTRLPVPKSLQIPLDGIVVFARPEDIFIVEGDYVAESGANYVLPDMYVISEQSMAEHTMRILTVNYLMEPIKKKIQRDKSRIALVI